MFRRSAPEDVPARALCRLPPPTTSVVPPTAEPLLAFLRGALFARRAVSSARAARYGRPWALHMDS